MHILRKIEIITDISKLNLLFSQLKLKVSETSFQDIFTNISRFLGVADNFSEASKINMYQTRTAIDLFKSD